MSFYSLTLSLASDKGPATVQRTQSFPYSTDAVLLSIFAQHTVLSRCCVTQYLYTVNSYIADAVLLSMCLHHSVFLLSKCCVTLHLYTVNSHSPAQQMLLLSMCTAHSVLISRCCVTQHVYTQSFSYSANFVLLSMCMHSPSPTEQVLCYSLTLSQPLACHMTWTESSVIHKMLWTARIPTFHAALMSSFAVDWA